MQPEETSTAFAREVQRVNNGDNARTRLKGIKGRGRGGRGSRIERCVPDIKNVRRTQVLKWPPAGEGGAMAGNAADWPRWAPWPLHWTPTNLSMAQPGLLDYAMPLIPCIALVLQMRLQPALHGFVYPSHVAEVKEGL